MQNLRLDFFTKNLMQFLNQQLNNYVTSLRKITHPLNNFYILNDIIHQFVAFANSVIKEQFQAGLILSKIVNNELKVQIESILTQNQLTFEKYFIKILSQEHKLVFCLCQLDIRILELKLIIQYQKEKKQIDKSDYVNIRKDIIKLVSVCRILSEQEEEINKFSDILIKIVHKTIESCKKIEYFETLEKIFRKTDLPKIVLIIEKRKIVIKQSITTKPKIQIIQQKNTEPKQQKNKLVTIKPLKKSISIQKKQQKKQNILTNTQNLQNSRDQVKIRKSIKIVPRTLHNRRKSIHKQIPQQMRIKKQNVKQYIKQISNNHNFNPIIINCNESENYANLENILGRGTPKKIQNDQNNV